MTPQIRERPPTGAPAVWQAALESAAAELLTAMDPWISVERCDAAAVDALWRGGRRFWGQIW